MSAAARHRYQALAHTIRDAIDHGSLTPGKRVPSVRHMALQRKVSITTVTQAYRLLEDQGLLEARPQSGYFVRPRPVSNCLMPRMAPASARPIKVGVGRLAASILRESGDPRLIPLGAASPAADTRPHDRIARLLAAAARERSQSLTSYQFSHTEAELSGELARRALINGYTVDPREIVATNGCIESINIALRALTQPGDVVVVESPTYFGILEILESLGLKAIEVPMHPVDGVSLEALRVALENHPVRTCIFLANAHNPLGCTLSDERKRELVALCSDYGVPIIEDDVYGEVTFAERRPLPLKAFDAHGDVVLCSSVSKTFAPGLRVGWIAAGRRLERVQFIRSLSSVSTPVVSQLAAARFMAGGGFDHYLRTIRRLYAERSQMFAQAAARHLPAGVRLSRPTGGYFIWVELPTGFDSLRFHERALAAGISIAPGAAFSPRRRFNNCFRLSTSMAWTPRVEQALATLGRLATEMVESVPTKAPNN